MCHRSWVAEAPDDVASNERLEFLGDAVLGWVVADLVFRDFGDLAEGALTDLRKSVVNANALADVARELDLGEHLLLGRGEDAAGGREKTSILSDAMEAVLGAVYLDGGRDAAGDAAPSPQDAASKPAASTSADQRPGGLTVRAPRAVPRAAGRGRWAALGRRDGRC